jgi:hypothetical protein
MNNELEMNMWEFKTDYKGNIATAVQRRIDLLGKKGAVDLNLQENLAKFGYNYLVWKNV